MMLLRLCVGLLVASWIAFWPARVAAETLYFVSLAKIRAGEQPNYDRFLAAVAPVWRRHGMRVLLRIKIDPKHRPEVGALDLDEIAVLTVRSRNAFRAYINDRDYRKIRADRLNSVAFFAVLEGKEADLEKLEELTIAKTTRVTLSHRDDDDEHHGITIKISLAAQVKGSLPNSLASVRAVIIEPASSANGALRATNVLDGRIH